MGEIQVWLLTCVSSQETAVLPEDKMQCLLVGIDLSNIFYHLKCIFRKHHLFRTSNSIQTFIAGIQPIRDSDPHQNGGFNII